MAQDVKLDPMYQELGKLICDRLGLNPDTTLKDWKAEPIGGSDKLAISMTTMVMMPRADYFELQALAEQRVKNAVVATPAKEEKPVEG